MPVQNTLLSLWFLIPIYLENQFVIKPVIRFIIMKCICSPSLFKRTAKSNLLLMTEHKIPTKYCTSQM